MYLPPFCLGCRKIISQILLSLETEMVSETNTKLNLHLSLYKKLMILGAELKEHTANSDTDLSTFKHYCIYT